MNVNSSLSATAEGDDNFYSGVSGSPAYDSVQTQQPANTLTAEEQAAREQAWRAELAKLEEEIATLRSVLDAKVKEAGALKQKLGITPLVEFTDDFRHGIQVIRESETVQKTNAALRSFGAFASKKFGEMRNSSVFKSVEERVGGAYSSVKDQISGSPSSQPDDFEDALRTDVNNQASTPTSQYLLTPASDS